MLNRTALTASASHVAIIGHTTPREFRLRLAEAEMSGGTYNRFLPIYVERSKRLPLPEPIPAEVLTTLGERLGEAIGHARLVSRRLALDPGARRAWSDLYDELTECDDEDEAWTEFTRRAAPYCLRIAGLHAVLANRTTITTDDLLASAAVVRYAISSARYVLDGQGRDHRLDKIAHAIDRSSDGLTRTEVSALFSRNVPAPVLDALLASLLGTGRYEAVEVKTGGRPTTRYRSTKKEERTDPS